MKRRKGETITLYCAKCTWSTELGMADTEHSQVVPCTHCNEPLYWHCCGQCGLKYVGSKEPLCTICDDPSLDETSEDFGV